MTETPAHKVRGFLIRDCNNGELLFRVYDKDNRRKFKDYEIRHHDLEIEIIDNYSSIFDGGTAEGLDGYVDYKSRTERHKLGG